MADLNGFGGFNLNNVAAINTATQVLREEMEQFKEHTERIKEAFNQLHQAQADRPMPLRPEGRQMAATPPRAPNDGRGRERHFIRVRPEAIIADIFQILRDRG